MEKKVKNDWVQALRSGKYKQTTGRLCRTKPKQKGGTDETPQEGSYCCLGVLCKLYAREKHQRAFIHTKKRGWRFIDGYSKSFGLWDMPPDEVLGFAKVHRVDAENLAQMNDDGATFEEIADYIENNL